MKDERSTRRIEQIVSSIAGFYLLFEIYFLLFALFLRLERTYFSPHFSLLLIKYKRRACGIREASPLCFQIILKWNNIHIRIYKCTF